MAGTWWPFWPFSKGASSPANFLHLSRVNISRICKLTSQEELLNPHQCRSMSSMLERTMRSLEQAVDLVDDVNLVCSSTAFENFYRVSEKAKHLVENCVRDDWCQESAFQIQNEEAFKEILLETSLCYNTIYKLIKNINGIKDFLHEDLRKSSIFDPPSADDVFEDLVVLQNRLKGLINDSSISVNHTQSQHLGKYLLRRVNFALQHSNDEDIDVLSFNLWSDGKGPDEEWSEKSEFLGDNVCKTAWLDVPCAKKLFQDEMQEDEWLAEAKILASLNHPNIVKFICCNKYETKHTRGHFIAMEQMDTSLGSFIKRLKEGGNKLSLLSALDIMLQIGYGMCYLHGNGIAHRDLKTSNVVVSKIIAQHLQYCLQVKVVDFGMSKVKLQDKSNTITRPKIGTTTYMPPEAFSNGKANWFKADVYSFSVLCSVILSGDEPFQGIERNDLCRAICSGERPMMPEDIPKELTSVISEGWATDRNSRPNFMNICTRLEKIRHGLLTDHTLGSSFNQEEQGYSTLYIEKVLKRRCEAREHARLRRPSISLTEKEECFDGDKLSSAPCDTEYRIVPEVSSEDPRNDRSRIDISLGGIGISLSLQMAENLQTHVENQLHDQQEIQRESQLRLGAQPGTGVFVPRPNCPDAEHHALLRELLHFQRLTSPVPTRTAGRLPVPFAERASVHFSPVYTYISDSSPVTSMSVQSAPVFYGRDKLAFSGVPFNYPDIGRQTPCLPSANPTDIGFCNLAFNDIHSQARSMASPEPLFSVGDFEHRSMHEIRMLRESQNGEPEQAMPAITHKLHQLRLNIQDHPRIEGHSTTVNGLDKPFVSDQDGGGASLLSSAETSRSESNTTAENVIELVPRTVVNALMAIENWHHSRSLRPKPRREAHQWEEIVHLGLAGAKITHDDASKELNCPTSSSAAGNGAPINDVEEIYSTLGLATAKWTAKL